MDPVNHFEVPADDLARAKKFYTDVFGWMLNDTPGMDYTIATTTESDPTTGRAIAPGAINGGMMKRTTELSTPIITLTVSSIDDALAKLEKAGGAVVEGKAAAGDMGWTAYFKDSEGNVMGLWQAAGK